MAGIIKAFGNDRPLHRQIGQVFLARQAAEALRGRQDFIDRPARGDMVDDDVGSADDRDAVILDQALAANARADIAHDDIVGVDAQRIVAQRNPGARRGLSGDGDIVVLDGQPVFQLDGAGDGEDHGARPVRFDRFAQGAGAAVIEIGDRIDRAAAPAGRIAAETVRAGEGDHWRSGRSRVGRARVCRLQRVPLPAPVSCRGRCLVQCRPAAHRCNRSRWRKRQ